MGSRVLNLRVWCFAIVVCGAHLLALTDRCLGWQASDYFGIRVVDDQTGRGVPLARLRTTGAVDYWTDSQGWVAFLEPGLMDQSVYFHVDSPGYQYAADGFGYRGLALQTTPGRRAEVRVERVQLAERLYRITGQGIYRDSQLLGEPFPAEVSQLNAGVIGQDSVQMVPFRGQLFWLWGDTNLPHYPLGNFHVTAALSPPPGQSGFDVEQCIPLHYFTDASTGRARKMLPMDKPGAVWLWGLINLEDDAGAETLIAHYSRHLSLGNMVEQGIAVWNEADSQFQPQVTIDARETWRFPRGQAVRHRDQQGDYVYFAEPFVTMRVPARISAVLDPRQYEAWAWDSETGQYRWQQQLPPTSQADESTLIRQEKLPRSAAHFQTIDRTEDRAVRMHRGSITWNAYRQRWIMIAGQIDDRGKPSRLGEIWYAEAPAIVGPWKEAVKIASHPEYSFYNPRQHTVLNAERGRVIYFEGTYTHMFSANKAQTPRYEYNQLMYRLDLDRVGEGMAR